MPPRSQEINEKLALANEKKKSRPIFPTTPVYQYTNQTNQKSSLFNPMTTGESSSHRHRHRELHPKIKILLKPQHPKIIISSQEAKIEVKRDIQDAAVLFRRVWECRVWGGEEHVGVAGPI